MRDESNPQGYTGIPGSTDGPEPWKMPESARTPLKEGFKFIPYSAEEQDELNPNTLMNGFMSVKQESEMDDGEVMDFPDYINRVNPPFQR